MKAFITCRRGLEEFVIKELEQENILNSEKKEGYVIFESKDYESLISFLYKSGIAIRGGFLLIEEKVGETLEESKKIIEPLIKSIPYEVFFDKATKFRAECYRKGEHKFKSNEFERLLGGMIFDELEKKNFEPVVDLKNPELNIFSQILNDNLLVGVDLIGFDANKRDYKLFSNSHSIKGDLGRAMLLLGLEGLDKGLILDPFCSDGVIGIELALYLSNKSHNNYRKRDFLFKKSKLFKELNINKILKIEDEKEKKDISFNINCFDSLFHNLKSTQKNAKIAGIDKKMNVSRIDPDMIDLKLEDNSVDSIITVLPSKSKTVEFGKTKKQVEGFAKQSNYILKKEKKIIILTELDEYINIFKDKGYNIDKTIKIGTNNRKIYVLSL